MEPTQDTVPGELHRSMKHAWETQEKELRKELADAQHRNTVLVEMMRKRTDYIRGLVKIIEDITYYNEDDRCFNNAVNDGANLDRYLVPVFTDAKRFLDSV